MPRILDYETVQKRMSELGMVCNYFNSGAFAFGPGVAVMYAGWLSAEDATIRPEMRARARLVAGPPVPTLLNLLNRIRKTDLSGLAWFMPMSHWAFELEYGCRDWMPPALAEIGLSADDLSKRTTAAAIEFLADESPALTRFLSAVLLAHGDSDFMLAFPDRPALCLVHHHQQLWWMTSEESLEQKLLSAAETE